MTTTAEIFQIGKTAPRADARAKVTGREKYAADGYADHQLWAGVKRAGVARQEHAYLETESGFAVFRESQLEITASTQTPFRDRAETAEALGVDLDKVRIIAPY